jgi:heme exporter protein D
MDGSLDIAIYTLLGIGISLLILVGALAVVDTVCRRNRQLKWVLREHRPVRRPDGRRGGSREAGTSGTAKVPWR